MDYVGTELRRELRIGKVFTIHYFQYGLQFNIPGEAHDFWELVYLDAGEASVWAGDRQFRLRQGEIVFHAPNEFHTIRTRDRFASSIILSFSCAGEAVRAFAKQTFFLNDEERDLLRRLVALGSEVFADKLNLVELKRMTRRKEAPFGGEQLILDYLEIFLVTVYRNHLAPRPPAALPARTTEGLAARISAYLDEHLTDDLSLAALAEVFHFSEGTLKKTFRREMGAGIMETFRKRRIDEAKRRIAAGRYSLAQIADALGFSSQAHFCRVFRQLVRMSPSEYARSVKVDHLLD